MAWTPTVTISDARPISARSRARSSVVAVASTWEKVTQLRQPLAAHHVPGAVGMHDDVLGSPDGLSDAGEEPVTPELLDPV